MGEKEQSRRAIGSERLLDQLHQLGEAMNNVQYFVEVVNQPVPGIDKLLKTMADTLETSIHPLVRVMAGKLDIDLRTQENTAKIFNELRQLRAAAPSSTSSSGKMAAKRNRNQIDAERE